MVLVFHVDGDAHPRMDAALIMMFALRQAINQKLAPLQDARSGNGEVFETAGAFVDRWLAAIEVANAPAASALEPFRMSRLENSGFFICLLPFEFRLACFSFCASRSSSFVFLFQPLNSRQPSGGM